jgi:hypothetical protein
MFTISNEYLTKLKLMIKFNILVMFTMKNALGNLEFQGKHEMKLESSSEEKEKWDSVGLL